MQSILPTLDIEVQRKFNNLFKLIQKESGVFLEAGANDGILDSYTYPLEMDHNWKGVLVEPSIPAFDRCKQNRKRSKCINYALTSDPDITEVFGDFADGHLMASVSGARRGVGNQVAVPATTLTKVFNEYLSDTQVDLMSIDVENYELEVLKGLDFIKYHPTYILIEIYTSSYDAVVDILTRNNYELISNVSGFNLIDNPGWDGTHNDYLFQYRK